MSTLLLRLAGPMQSWGDSSRYATRSTSRIPTKSGILGLVAAAQGRRRTDPVEDLVELRFGVRVDQPGKILSDFQTARTLDTNKSMPLTTRYYLADAIFVAGLEGDQAFLEGLDAALRSPRYAPYLGRRAFTPVGDISLGITERPLQEALETHPWEASEWFQKRRRSTPYFGRISVDSQGWDPNSEQSQWDASEQAVRDVPLSWDIEHRKYGWRKTKDYMVQLSQQGGFRRQEPMEVFQ